MTTSPRRLPTSWTAATPIDGRELRLRLIREGVLKPNPIFMEFQTPRYPVTSRPVLRIGKHRWDHEVRAAEELLDFWRGV